MVDRDGLKASYRLTVMSCSGITLIPVMLVYVGWFMYRSPGGSGTPGSGTLALSTLLVFGALGLSPLLTVPLLTYVFEHQLVPAPSPPASAAALMRVQAMTRYALWEIASLIGFVGFFMGASWLYFIGLVAFTYCGYAVTFPRWSSWLERADELDRQSRQASSVP